MHNTSYSARNIAQKSALTSTKLTTHNNHISNQSKSPQRQKTISPQTKKPKTADIQQINQMAERHYRQAMKYVYKKNDQHAEMLRKEAEKKKPEKDKLTEEHTFQPYIRNNKYNKKVQQIKEKNNKTARETSVKRQVQLTKWGQNKQQLRRQKIIKGQVRILRTSLEKQGRSLQNSRNSSLENSSIQKFIKESTTNLSKSRQSQADRIPGVRKFYLNQAKAQVAKTRHEKLLFRGNETIGFYF